MHSNVATKLCVILNTQKRFWKVNITLKLFDFIFNSLFYILEFYLKLPGGPITFKKFYLDRN